MKDITLEATGITGFPVSKAFSSEPELLRWLEERAAGRLALLEKENSLRQLSLKLEKE